MSSPQPCPPLRSHSLAPTGPGEAIGLWRTWDRLGDDLNRYP